MHLTAIISPIRDSKAVGRPETRDITAEDSDYETTKGALVEQLPVGWSLLAIRQS